MQFAPIGKESALMILHLLGDPIHSTFSLLAKVEDWRQCLSRSEELRSPPANEKDEEKHGDRIIRSRAVIAAVTKELHEDFSTKDLLEALSKMGPHINERIYNTASALVDSRDNEMFRTCLAIVLYIFQVIAAFVSAVGEASSPSGGRIGPAMLLSWLLPVVLLSNVVSDLGSRSNCMGILVDFLKDVDKESSECFDMVKKSEFFGKKLVKTSYFESLAWSGGVYTCRPDKVPFSFSKRGALLALVSVLPVTIAFGTAFAVLYTAPTWFSCRHLIIIFALGFWIISTVATWSMARAGFATGKYLWYCILIKDVVIAAPILGLIIASSCGVFNSCYCWSGALVLGRKNARAPMNPTTTFDRNDQVIYPAMVATGLFLQLCVFGAMLWVGWSGLSVMWWSETEKREASETKGNGSSCADKASQTDSRLKYSPMTLGPSKLEATVTVEAIKSS